MLEYIGHYIAEVGMALAIVLASAACILGMIRPDRSALSTAAIDNVMKGAVILFILSVAVIAY